MAYTFPTSVNVTQAPAVAGDWASANPRHSALSVPGGYYAGPNGLTMALFAWQDTATGPILSNSGTGAPTGFVHRDKVALITTYLTGFGMTIPAGLPVGCLFNAGDLFAMNTGTNAVTVGMSAFANNTNGTVSFAPAGTTVTGSTQTRWLAMTGGQAGELVKMSTTPLG